MMMSSACHRFSVRFHWLAASIWMNVWIYVLTLVTKKNLLEKHLRNILLTLELFTLTNITFILHIDLISDRFKHTHTHTNLRTFPLSWMTISDIIINVSILTFNEEITALSCAANISQCFRLKASVRRNPAGDGEKEGQVTPAGDILHWLKCINIEERIECVCVCVCVQ